MEENRNNGKNVEDDFGFEFNFEFGDHFFKDVLEFIYMLLVVITIAFGLTQCSIFAEDIDAPLTEIMYQGHVHSTHHYSNSNW